MKKLFPLLLLCLTLAFCATALAEEGAAALPQAGDTLGGFTVKSVTPMELLNATGVLFEHEKTGAQLLYLATEDTNRSFDITFRTPALDDTGKPHVFEHMTIGGSEKYPDANMFFSVKNQSYNTYMNALTYHGMTTYPLASLSEDQLMTLMDYYLSGVFSPLMYSEPRMTEREAWRYALNDADAPLTIAGTVYSEMQGALTLSRQAIANSMYALFQGGLTAHENGGLPEAITTLTNQALIDFHDAYYHPSNALIVLYGKLDYARFMNYIDEEYLSKYEKADVYVEMGRVEPYDETVYATYDFPVEQGAQTENASYIYYAFGADGAEMEDFLRLNVLTNVLKQESSPLMIALREAFPGANIGVDVEIDAPSPYFFICASGVNESDRDLFVQTVDESLAQIGRDGFDQESLDAVLAAYKLSMLQTAENDDLGVDASQDIALGWTYFGRIDYYAAFQTVLNAMDAQQTMDTLNKWLTNNAYRAVSVTRPAAGKAEENAAALETALAEKKAAMTDEEIEAAIQNTAEFAAWSAAPASEEILSELLIITPENLPVELTHYEVTDETRDGIRYVTAPTQVSGLADVTLRLDASVIPAEQLLDVELLLNMMGEIDTDKHTKEELSQLLLRRTDGFAGYMQALSSEVPDGETLKSALFTYVVLKENVTASVSLLREILLETDVTDTDSIRAFLSRVCVKFEQGLDSNVNSIQLRRMRAIYGEADAFNEHLHDFDYYNGAKELLALDDEQLIARLTAAEELLLNQTGAIVTCAGDQETIDAVCAEIGALLKELPALEREKADHRSLFMEIDWEAITVNATVQVNVIAGASEGYSGKNVVAEALINDQYMIPKLRNALGAYGAYARLRNTYAALYTYRDPNLASTFDVFAALPEYLRTTEITQEMVDTYIVGSYSKLSRPSGILTGASEAITNHLTELSEETRIERMEDAKKTTVADIRATADVFEALVKEGARSTSATASTIEKNRELFTSVLRLDDGESE